MHVVSPLKTIPIWLPWRSENVRNNGLDDRIVIVADDILSIRLGFPGLVF